MRRILASLLVLVMVLAPCAVGHAMNAKHVHAGIGSHHSLAEMHNSANTSQHDGHQDHGSQHTTQNNSDDEDCSGGCDILQRASVSATPDRGPTVHDTDTTKFALFVILRGPTVAPVPELMRTPPFGPAAAKTDSQFVLRMSARIRI